MKRTIAEISAIAFLILAVAGIIIPSYLRRSRAKQELGEAARELAVAPSALIKQLGDPATRLAAARELGRLKDREAADFIPYCLTDADPEVRRACLWALGEIGEPKAMPHVRWRLSDQDLGVRVAAAEALAKVPDAEGTKELVTLLRDPEAEVREAARKALLKIGAPALDDLDAAVHGGGMDVRPALVELVAAIGGAQTVPTLVKLLATADPISRERRDAKLDDAVRRAAVAALGKLGAPAAEALGRQLANPRCSFEHKKTLAEAFRLLGKPAIEPVARHVLAWKSFPREDELRLWAGVLEAIGKGEAQAEAALQRATEQFAATTDVGGASLPREPAELRIVEVPDLTPYSPVELPPVPKELPANGQAKLLLHNALIGGKRSRALPGHTLELNLLRHRGQWLKDFWGKSTTYNQGDHEGEIVERGEGEKLRLEVCIADDNWVQGGFGKYEVELRETEAGYVGSHHGGFNGQDVKGDVTVVPQEWPESAFAPWAVEPGEHPRLLFRKSQLPRMRQRAQTELGRAIVKALRAKVNEDGQGIDHAIAWGLLGLLLDDPGYSRQAIQVLRHGMKAYTVGHQHDSARKMLPVSLAYDLAYPAMTEAEVKEFNDYVVREGQALGRFGLGNNCLSANSNWCAISFGPAVMITLAGLREKGPFDLAEPKAQPPAAVVAPVGGASAPRDGGTPTADFMDGELLREWLVIGPFAGGGAETPRLPDAPQEGTAVAWEGKTLKFARLPESAIHKTPPFLKLPGVIRFTEAPAGSRHYLFGFLKTAKEQGAQIRIPVGENASASLAINGRRFADGDIVALQPGTHRLLLEVAGPAVSPWLTAADHGQRLGLWERYQREKRRWDALKAQHEKTGEAPQVPLGLTTSSRYVNLWFTHAIGDHAWKTEPEGYTMISLDMVLPAASAYPTVTGHPLVAGSGLAWAMPLQLMRTCGSGGGGYSGSDAPFSTRHLCYATHLSRPELQPALVWEFNRRLLPDKLGTLSCQELAFALAYFPLDVKPRPPEEVMPKAIADRRKGAFLFRNAFRDFVGGAVGGASAPRENGDIVATMFYRAEWPYGGTYFHPQAGSFRISGLGTAWANGIVGNKRQWDYADEVALHVEGSNGDGLGKVTYFEGKPDGSGVVGADMSDVYNRAVGGASPPRVQAERHFAVDYSGASGAPALFAVVDRVKGGGKKSWRLHTEGKSLAANGATFTIEGGAGATLQGRFISPAGLHIVASGNTLSAVTEAPEADFMVVMTIQKGAAPELKADGSDLAATASVGQRTVSFQGGRLLIAGPR
ncbi:MAG: HEAT repeat domain-containing protein [Planctomycetes bacterium]|nr:HEAT repeat domain-containing protein [Planctomycetota bacterium]